MAVAITIIIRGGGFWPGVAIGAGIGSAYGYYGSSYYGSSPDYYDDGYYDEGVVAASPARPATIPWRIACRRTDPTIRSREPISAMTGGGTPARNGMIS